MNEKQPSELDFFWAALMFYTRIPVPKSAVHSQHALNKSRKYFPLVGLIIGLIGGGTFVIANTVFSTQLSLILSIICTVLATGAFHEDGFADSCDAFGGGWSPTQVLTIMKDSRLGSYATLGLLLLLATKLFALIDIAIATSTMQLLAIYASGHTLSRAVSSTMIDFFDYVQDIDKSKVKPITESKLAPFDTLISILITAFPLVILACLLPVITTLASLLCIATGLAFMGYSRHRIGGYTGDVLGATQQLAEVAFYLGFAACL